MARIEAVPRLSDVHVARPAQTNPSANEFRKVQLRQIAWGERDERLARIVLQNIADTTPPIVIRFNPFTHRRLCAFLRSCGIVH